MSVHIRNLKKDRGGRKSKSGNLGGVFITIARLLFVSGVIFFVVNLRVSINEKAESLNRDAARIKKKIHNLNREIEHLKIQREMLSSWPHIKRKINEFNLPLRSPDPSQVKSLALTEGPREKRQQTLKLSQR